MTPKRVSQSARLSSGDDDLDVLARRKRLALGVLAEAGQIQRPERERERERDIQRAVLGS